MRKLLRKIAAVVATAAIAVSAMVIPTTTASAASVFSNATKMEAMENYKIQGATDGNQKVFKIIVPKDGQLTFRWGNVERCINGHAYLYNANAESVYNFNMHSSFGDINCKNLKTGTYYLEIKHIGEKGYIDNLYYTFTPTKKPTISLKATIKKGTSLQLGSVVENYSGKVTWTSTKKTVATVSSTGKVTAKKSGTTTIRAKLSSGEYVQIKLVVTSK
ncbi:MAG: Ig-like domain-containing protein [Oscillospiraceae bacterium]